MPPGIVFLNNEKFGQWYFESSQYFWKFYRSYKKLPIFLGWKSFKPSKNFFQSARDHKLDKKPFLGLNNEFGSQGEISLEFLPRPQKNQIFNSIKFSNLFKKYLKTNYN